MATPPRISLKFVRYQNARWLSKKKAVQQPRTELPDSQLKTDSLFPMHEQVLQCKVLSTDGRIMHAAVSLLDIINNVGQHVSTTQPWTGLLVSFGVTRQKRVSNPCRQSSRG
jgi:hypothetical protein